MKFESKFNIDDRVYYWSDRERKVLFGRVNDISMLTNSNSSNSKVDWKYYLKPVFTDRNVIFNECVPEYLVFENKDAVLDFAVKLTEIINK